jgi:hypothetical protein
MSTDAHTMIGAWALDAVDADERALVEQHFASCDSCAQEAAELREAVAHLADVTIAEPPPRLRASVLAEVRRTRQEAPSEPAPEAAPQPTAPPRHRARRGFRLPSWRLAFGGAVLALTAALAAVFVTVSLMQSPPSQADRITAVLESADAQFAYQEAEGGGRVAVISSDALDDAVVVLSDLASPGEDRAYQVWMVAGAVQVSAGVMDSGDSSATMLIEGIGDTELIGVTEEPSGGSDTPTLPMVAGVPLVT